MDIWSMTELNEKKWACYFDTTENFNTILTYLILTGIQDFIIVHFQISWHMIL